MTMMVSNVMALLYYYYYYYYYYYLIVTSCNSAPILNNEKRLHLVKVKLIFLQYRKRNNKL